jgi:uncharacterized integral membrane protein (TIGR00698 family)
MSDHQVATPAGRGFLASRSVKALSSTIPGLLLACIVAGVCLLSRHVPQISFINPIFLSVVLGMIIASLVPLPDMVRPGLAFAAKVLLRISIVLLGLQFTGADVLRNGLVSVVVCVGLVGSTFVLTRKLGALLGVDRGLSELLASGTAICGASAILAVNTVTHARDSDVVYALACITFFGTIAIVLYPAVQPLLDLDPQMFGFWAGGSIHEVAQVIAAAAQGGPDALAAATLVKLSRVLTLAPLILILGVFRGGPRQDQGRPPLIPWFIAGFLVLIVFGSVVDIPHDVRQFAASTTNAMFAVALAALGLSTHFGAIAARGWRPIVVAAGSWLFIATSAMIVVQIGGRYGWL